MQNTASRIILSFISVIIGCTFIYSAYTKLYTLESFQSFEFTIIEYLKFPWLLATLSSRLLIGLEISLGVLITFHFYGNLKWILKLASLLLVIFSIYLVYLWVVAGNNINCGCFGDAIWMSPASSLIKNIILLAGIWLLIKYRSGIPLRRAHTWSLILLLLITPLPFILYPLPATQPQWLQKDHFKLNMSLLYKEGKKDKPKEDLYQGKHIIAFFSLGCPHCQMAAYKMHLMKEKNPSLPLYMVIAGRQQNWKPFWDKAKAYNIPYTRLEADEFTGLIGYSWPVIYWVNKGWVEAETNYMQMSQDEIENWLKAP